MGHQGKSRRLRAGAASAAICLLCIGGVTAARAQDPVEPPEITPPENPASDTELSPQAKENTQWSLVAGAKYRAGGKLVNDASPTDHTVDFFTTSFSPTFIDDPANPEGFFGGAECIDEVEFDDEALRSCERRPALYRFWIDDVGDEHIDKVPTDELVDDPEKPGFIGAVAWIDGKRALAVGGSGTYPRREPSPPAEGEIEAGESHDAAYLRKDKQGDPNSEDKPAGYARAWLYEDPDGAGEKGKEWREITDELPKDKDHDFTGTEEPMGALTALECTPLNIAEAGANGKIHIPKGTCLAGGMQRMWWWDPPSADKVEGFRADPVTNLEVISAISGVSTNKPDFHHRVRQIRFSTTTLNTIAAVTSGCCVERLQSRTGPDGLPSGNPDAALGGRVLNYSASQDRWSATSQVHRAEDAGALGAPLADSIYSLATRHGTSAAANRGFISSGVASPGSRPSPGSEEPGSRITGAGDEPARPDWQTSLRTLDSVRLTAADGDFGAAKMPTYDAVGTDHPSTFEPDGMLDWAVGSLKQGSFEGTAQGVAYTTLDSLFAAPAPYSCPLYTFVVTNQGGNCELVRENITEASLKSKRLIGMGTYALNALHFVLKTKNAWTAGDRGAIARLGAAGKLGSEVEPDAPHLKPGRRTKLAERAPYEDTRPDPGEPEGVPPRAARPVETLPKREIVPYGSADPTRSTSLGYEVVTAMAMSRDGSEGWAIGSGTSSEYGNVATLQHFDGERWRRCLLDGLGGVHEPDAACRSVASLLQPKADLFQSVNLTAITRIPLEKDGDPTNDDEFAAMAIGTRPDPSTPGSTVLIYRDGVWKQDLAASKVINVVERSGAEASIVFNRPGDAWLALNYASSGRAIDLYHYGGGEWPAGRWVECGHKIAATTGECGGADALERFSGRTASDLGAEHGYLQAAGDAVFLAGNRTVQNGLYPFVYSKRPGQPWKQEYDPGCEEIITGALSAKSCRPQVSDDDDPLLNELQGQIWSFTVTELGGGRIAGWLVGDFGRPEVSQGAVLSNDYTKPFKGPKYTLMRRDPDIPVGTDGAWSVRKIDDAAKEHLPPIYLLEDEPPRIVSFRGDDGREEAFISTSGGRYASTYNPPLEYDADTDRWRVMSSPIRSTTDVSNRLQLPSAGNITAIAADNQAGVWITARPMLLAPHDSLLARYLNMASHGEPVYYYRYTKHRPKAVFEDSPSPISEAITDLDGNADGTVLVSTESERLYRYDRIAGWERVSIPEWDPGRVVTKRSRAYAVSVNDRGEGIVVGEKGRIATISPNDVTVDPASIHRCSESPPPCGTPRDLHAAAVAPEGSAMAGGDNLTTSWRPPGGQFRLVDGPRSSASARITGLSMPDPSRAWAALDNGEIWAGTLINPGGVRPWQWRRESTTPAAREERGIGRLFAIEVDAGGRGLAVGYRGAMLERQEDGKWSRLNTGFLDNFFSVALPPQGYGDGTLVGGGGGIILTRANGRFHLARAADQFDPLVNAEIPDSGGRIVGMAISGNEQNDTEAWAAIQTGLEFRRIPEAHAVLHFNSGDDPTLSPPTRAESLGDAPPERSDEISFAAFGRSECQIGHCSGLAGNNLFNDILARRINEEIVDRTGRSEGPVAAISTGDLNDSPGKDDVDTKLGSQALAYPRPPHEPNASHSQWRQFVPDALMEDGVATFGALGERDLTRQRVSGPTNDYYFDSRDLAPTGAPKQWRESFAAMPAPWGKRPKFETDAYEYRPVLAGATAIEQPDVAVTDPTAPVSDQTVEDPTKGTEDPTVNGQTYKLPRQPDQKLPPRLGDHKVEAGAHTHYALDVVRKADGEVLSRLVVADTSNLRSLAASDPNQNPIEPQQAWLEQVLCIKGSATDTGTCTRAQGTAAVVVTTTPPYSYGAGAVEQTQQEAAAFEALMLRHQVTALITGHMGWNGLYYTFAPSLHYPQPGGAHPDSTRPPTGPGDDRGPDPSQLPVDPSDLSGDNAVTGALPTVIASSAGGRFGPRGEDSGTASQGYWHGYSVIRVPADGDPRKVIVEQRPILDWINLTAKSHVLRPQQRLALEGIGREPYGVDTTEQINEISSYAITHCYDLVYADPEKPWLPLEAEDASDEQLAAQGEGCHTRESAAAGEASAASADSASSEDKPGECDPYVCLSPSIGTINDQTGAVRAGSGQQERTFGLAILSVGEQTATWPIAFEPRPSFSPPRVPPPPPPPPAAPPAPPANPPVGTVGNLNLPTPPALPSLPLGAELVPPAPPIPPPPPGAANVAPLNLFLSTPGINVAPQSTVIPPPAPPIQPAPPGGARKEARQRQAAAQKSGSEVSEGAEQTQNLGGDLANAPESPDQAMTRRQEASTRRDRIAPGQSFTPLTHHPQPSAWATGLQWGGGMTLMAMVMWFGWMTVRPTPRRREPELPAPAFSRAGRRRR